MLQSQREILVVFISVKMTTILDKLQFCVNAKTK